MEEEAQVEGEVEVEGAEEVEGEGEGEEEEGEEVVPDEAPTMYTSWAVLWPQAKALVAMAKMPSEVKDQEDRKKASTTPNTRCC